MAATICFIAGIYISIGVYGVVLVAQGIQGILRRQITMTYHTLHFALSGISTQSKSSLVVDDNAVKWSIVRVISGLLAFVPWLIPMIWDMPLTWWFVFAPFVGLVLHFAASQLCRFAPG